jgi:dienelactone hydrolase
MKSSSSSARRASYWVLMAMVMASMTALSGLVTSGVNPADAASKTTLKTKVKTKRTTRPATTRPITTQPSTTQPSTTQPSATQPSTTQPSPVGATFAVTSRTENFEDTSRGTAATKASAASTSRKLPTLVFAPRAPGTKFPLFVFGHGLGGSPKQYETLLTAIAARGYVVAAPAFPLSNKDAPGGPNLFDEPNQPGDMSYVVTQMLKDPAVNPDLIVAGGHSLGAITTIDLIANSCCFDKRIDAAVMVAGTANVFTTGKLFTGPAVPSLYIHGDKDPTVSYSLGYSTWQTAQTPKWFVTVIGGDHVFGIAGKPELQQQTGALIVDAAARFADSRTKDSGDTTKLLQEEVDANPTVLKLESKTK